MDSTSEVIRSVQRALLVLKVLNERELWTLLELQQRTNLPKSTLHRLLATLRAEHYVHSGEEMYGMYRLTRHVTDLSKGFVEKNRLADVAGPIVIAATKKYRWPLGVGVIEGHELRVNLCSMPYSPYSTKPTSFGQRYGLLDSALGSTYLAFTDASERRILLRLLSEKNGASSVPQGSVLRALVRKIRKQGFGVKIGAGAGESSAVAVPIRANSGELLGVLACSTFAQSLDAGWIHRILPVVRHTATQIASAYECGTSARK